MQSFLQRLCCLFILLGANTYGSTLLVLGDSLSAGYGVNQGSGWVALLRNDLGEEHSIINGSISGDTTGGGLYRLPQLLEKFTPDYVLLELGGNGVGIAPALLDLCRHFQIGFEMCELRALKIHSSFHA